MLLKMPHRRFLLLLSLLLGIEFLVLRVKSRRPLGEDEMRRLLNRGDA